MNPGFAGIDNELYYDTRPDALRRRQNIRRRNQQRICLPFKGRRAQDDAAAAAAAAAPIAARSSSVQMYGGIV